MRNQDGEEAVCWYTDASEAKTILEMAISSNPSVEGLHLAVHGLGSAFAMCKGWPEEDGLDLQAQGSEFQGSLKLQGTHGLVKEIAPRLEALMKEQGMDAGAWTLPIFICQELQGPSILPVFFHPADLTATWEKV